MFYTTKESIKIWDVNVDKTVFSTLIKTKNFSNHWIEI